MVIKVWKDKTYHSMKHEDGDTGCQGCAGYGSEVCPALCDRFCSLEYVFKVKEEPTQVCTQQGVKYDDNKLQYSLLPPYALEAVAQNLTDGLKKYPERNNWLKVDNAQERYLDALYRHLEAHRKGEIYDTDNVNPENTHMAAVVANSLFLLEFMLNPELKGNT